MIEQLLESTLVGLKRENLELANAIEKWSHFLLGRIMHASLKTDMEPEDVFSEMMIGLLKVGEMYSHPLYRFQKNLFYITAFDGHAVRIKTLDSNKLLKRELWTNVENLEAVKRGSISSSVYREINQKYCNLLNSSFSAKNGYEKTEAEDRVVVVRSGSTGLEARKQKVRDMKKVVHQVSLQDHIVDLDEYDTRHHPTNQETVEYLTTDVADPETGAISREVFYGLRKSLSSPAQKVLGCLAEDPSLTDSKLARLVKYPTRVISAARDEIFRDFDILDGFVPPVAQGKYPVYLRASDLC